MADFSAWPTLCWSGKGKVELASSAWKTAALPLSARPAVGGWCRIQLSMKSLNISWMNYSLPSSYHSVLSFLPKLVMLVPPAHVVHLPPPPPLRSKEMCVGAQLRWAPDEPRSWTMGLVRLLRQNRKRSRHRFQDRRQNQRRK